VRLYSWLSARLLSPEGWTGAALVFCGYDKILEIIPLKEGRFIWAHSFGGFSPWLVGSLLWGRGEPAPHDGICMLEQSCLPHGIQEAENGRGRGPNIPFSQPHTSLLLGLIF
jgi:hypothetical protein